MSHRASYPNHRPLPSTHTTTWRCRCRRRARRHACRLPPGRAGRRGSRRDVARAARPLAVRRDRGRRRRAERDGARRPPTTTARPARARCSARASTSAASSSTPTTPRRRATTCAATGRAAATFPWYALQRQVSLRGVVERVTPEETRAYWVTRPRGSQLGAWASAQSAPVADRRRARRRPRRDRAALRRRRRGPGAAALGRLADRSRDGWSSGRAGRTACTTGCGSSSPSTGRGESGGSLPSPAPQRWATVGSGW